MEPTAESESNPSPMSLPVPSSESNVSEKSFLSTYYQRYKKIMFIVSSLCLLVFGIVREILTYTQINYQCSFHPQETILPPEKNESQ